MKKTLLKTLTGTVIALWLICHGPDIFAQSSEVRYNNLPQQSSLVTVSLKHDRYYNAWFESQNMGVIITNRTSDKVFIKLRFTANLTCGQSSSQQIGFMSGDGITLEPNQTIGETGYSGTRSTSLDVAYGVPANCRPAPGKEKNVSIISSVNYQLISAENIGERERKLAEEDKRRKEEQLERERMALAAQQKQQEDLQKAKKKEENDALRGETQFLVDELPAEERVAYRSKVSSVAQLPADQQKAGYENLQKDLANKRTNLIAEKQAKDQETAKRESREKSLRSKIDGIENPVDREKFESDLTKLRSGEQSEADYNNLEKSVTASKETETKISKAAERNKETLSSMSADHRSRDEPKKRKEEMEEIENNPSLSNEEKLKKIEDVNRKLQHNKAVLADDENRKSKADKEISDIERRNKERAVAQGAAITALGVGVIGSISNAEVKESNIFSKNSIFHLSTGFGLAVNSIPTPVVAKFVTQQNNGTGAALATTKNTTEIAYRGVFATGLTGHLGIYPFAGENFSFGFSGNLTWAPFNLITALSALASSMDSTSTTSTSDSGTEAYSNNFNWNAGVSLTYGWKTFKGLLDVGYGGYNTDYGSTYVSKNEYGKGGFTIINEDEAGTSKVNYLRVMTGLRFGDLSKAEAVIIDLKVGKDFINSYEIESMYDTGSLYFGEETQKISAPLLMSFSAWKQHKFIFSVMMGINYFEMSDKFFGKSSLNISFSRTFDFRK